MLDRLHKYAQILPLSLIHEAVNTASILHIWSKNSFICTVYFQLAQHSSGICVDFVWPISPRNMVKDQVKPRCRGSTQLEDADLELDVTNFDLSSLLYIFFLLSLSTFIFVIACIDLRKNKYYWRQLVFFCLGGWCVSSGNHSRIQRFPAEYCTVPRHLR